MVFPKVLSGSVGSWELDLLQYKYNQNTYLIKTYTLFILSDNNTYKYKTPAMAGEESTESSY